MQLEPWLPLSRGNVGTVFNHKVQAGDRSLTTARPQAPTLLDQRNRPYTCLYSPVLLLSRFWGITRVQSLLYRVVPENSVPRTRMWQAAPGPREFLLLICACVCVHACVCAHVFTCACIYVCVCESVRMWRPEVNSGATQKLSTFPLRPGAC